MFVEDSRTRRLKEEARVLRERIAELPEWRFIKRAQLRKELLATEAALPTEESRKYKRVTPLQKLRNEINLTEEQRLNRKVDVIARKAKILAEVHQETGVSFKEIEKLFDELFGDRRD